MEKEGRHAKRSVVKKTMHLHCWAPSYVTSHMMLNAEVDLGAFVPRLGASWTRYSSTIYIRNEIVNTTPQLQTPNPDQTVTQACWSD